MRPATTPKKERSRIARLTKAAGKPKKRRSRSPKKRPAVVTLPTRQALVKYLANASDVHVCAIVSDNVHIEDVGKPFGDVLFRRLFPNDKPEPTSGSRSKTDQR